MIGSGSTPFLKGDVITEDFFIECKTKAKPSSQITVKKEWLEKAREQAYQMRKSDYILALSLGDGRDYYMITPQLFHDLYVKAKALDKVWDTLEDANNLSYEAVFDKIVETNPAFARMQKQLGLKLER